MATENLIYSNNWNNKLDCTLWIDIRKHSTFFEMGKFFDVILKGIFKCRCQIIHKATVPGKDIHEVLLWLCTGYSAAETIKILCQMHKITPAEYYAKMWDVIYCKRIDRKNSDL